MTETALRLAGLTRYGQVNFTEDDVRLLDVGFWRDVWRRSRLQAVLLNCGGIMAYHPTGLTGHPVAAGVDRRDLFGEMVAAAREMGIEVVGRLDVGVVDQRFRDLHPTWMMADAEGRSRTLNEVTGGTWGRPGGYRIENEMYYTCINSGLFDDYLPALLAEVAERYDVAGFFTNGFPTVALASPSTRMLCHCDRCTTLWADYAGGAPFPTRDDPADPVFRRYVRFLREMSLARFRALRRHVKAISPGLSFNTSAVPAVSGGLPWTEWVAELDVLFCDNQDRSADYGRTVPSHGLWEVGLSSELLRSVSDGKPALRVQSTARMRGGGRHSSKNPAELRLQRALALAHGELPVWHAVSGRQHSRRWLDGVVAFDQWLADNTSVLAGGRSLADVGVVWSQESAWLQNWNAALPGPVFRDALSGWHLALSRARVPAQLVLADGIESFSGLRVLVLPSSLALTAQAVARIVGFAQGGGAVVVCGTAGMLDEWGVPYEGDPIGSLVGVTRDADAITGPEAVSYLRLDGDPVARSLLPAHGDDDVVPGGTWLVPFHTELAETALKWNEAEFMIPTHAAGLPAASHRPSLARRTTPVRSAYLAVDLDARFFTYRGIEHRRLLAGLVRWGLAPAGPTFEVEGAGVVDVRGWRTGDELVIVVTNLDNHGAHDEPVEEFRPVGPLRVRVRGASPVGAEARLHREGGSTKLVDDDGALAFVLDRVVDFEVATLPGGAR
ncbi:beta-galactosidase trimerization domain-containing protein [Actinomadura vinacea]|uniref:Beta-galactosidase trimerization domain-containing protein n=1 Tax=Actinomadura vinacea TaxID=115336 RepID=A0ABN3KKU5_9ACTN